MAQDSAQIRAQIEAARAQLENDIDEFGPVVSRRLNRARRLAQAGALAGFALIVRRLLGRKHKHHQRGRARGGCCSKCRGKQRRR
jgi:hypothetical protein